MVRTITAVMAVSLILATPALARDKARPITRREPDALDVAKTPMTDLNISGTQIPALLVEAEKRPYSIQNLETCAQITAAVQELDSILGPDIDLPRAERARFSKGRLAQWAIGKFIPFRSLIREVSGANRQQREIGDAIQAGLARRAFLKGIGSTRECPYPASPATESIIAQHAAALDQEDRTARIDPDPTLPAASATSAVPGPAHKPVFTAEPVVQPTR
jgi:hypothetical protein